MNQHMRWLLRCATLLALGAATGCGGEAGEGFDEEGADDALGVELEEEAASEDGAELTGVCKPDLIIQPLNNPCIQRKVWWRVVNVGCAAAGPSTATIRFDSATPKSYAIPALAVSEGSDMIETKFGLPSDGEVGILITADAKQQVSESKESNNFHSDQCNYN